MCGGGVGRACAGWGESSVCVMNVFVSASPTIFSAIFAALIVPVILIFDLYRMHRILGTQSRTLFPENCPNQIFLILFHQLNISQVASGGRPARLRSLHNNHAQTPIITWCMNSAMSEKEMRAYDQIVNIFVG